MKNQSVVWGALGVSAFVCAASCSSSHDFGNSPSAGASGQGQAGNTSTGGSSSGGGKGSGGSNASGSSAGGDANLAGESCAAGCGSESPLSVLSISPADGATSIARNSPIVVTFSDPVAQASVTASSLAVTVGTTAIAGTFSVAGAKVTFTSTLALPPSADVHVSVGTAVHSLAGGSLAAAVDATFTTADGTWATPTMVAGSAGGDVVSLKVFPLAHGALAVWARMYSATQIGSLWSSTYSGTAWSTAKQIDDADAMIASYNSAAFALDRSGNAAVGWVQNKKLRVAHYTAGAWQKSIELGTSTTGDAVFGGLAFDAAGNAFATWSQTSETYFDVWAARYDSKKGWGGQGILDLGNNKADLPSLAVSASGRALVTWRQNSQAWGDYYSTDWQGAVAVALGASGTVLSGGAPAFTSDTDALVLWRVFPGSGTPQVWSAAYAGASGWQAGAAVPLPQASSLDVNYPMLAAHGLGAALAVWTDDGESLEWGSTWSTPSGWKTAGQVGMAGTGDYASAVLDLAGNGVGTWVEGTSTVARRYLTGLGWSAAHTLMPSDSMATSFPVAASDESGTTWVAWAYQGQGWASAFQ